MSTAEPTVCRHCGAPTRGGEYAPGHDAKHRGELHRAVLAGLLMWWAWARTRTPVRKLVKGTRIA